MPDTRRPRAWLLAVDGAAQSYVDLDDPLRLEFEYIRRLGHVLDLAGPSGAPLDLLHLGGGGMTLPRYVHATRSGSRQRVVERDAALTRLVQDHLPLPAGADIAVEAGDAREALDASPRSSVDVVLADVFVGDRVPARMTTARCAEAADRVLRASGLYAANLADAEPFDFLARQIATFQTRFAHVCVVAEPAVLRGRRFGNMLLLASREPLPATALAGRTAADPFPARVVAGTRLARLRGRAAPVEDDASAVASPRPPTGSFSL
ncbi:spermidine synthase [Streptomyces sp. TR06-5]|uniref:spermidine synthase n=1 Tax=unclassified Streptomyces TaxID=2593676 RepID=UPI0039A0612B